MCSFEDAAKMTLGISWVRIVGGVKELIVASDSRLSGGQHWDACPKIMLLPRSDAVISFAGLTADAYPLMLQAYNTIKMYPPAENRAMDLAELKGHLIRVFNHSRSFIGSLPVGQKVPDAPQALFALSGYSWLKNDFRIWTLFFDPHIGKYTFRPTGSWKGQSSSTRKIIAYIGDNDAIDEARKMLVKLLKEREMLSSGSFNMEPFEVLRDLIRGGRFPSVGGPIQLVKIYQHSNAVPVGVYWPTKEAQKTTVLGRPLLDFEKCSWGVVDPDNPDRAFPA